MKFINKWLMAIFLFLIVTYLKSQHVVDAHAISERHFWFNSIPQPYLTGFSYYPNDFSDKEKSLINRLEMGVRYTPLDFLLGEDENWALRSWYELDLQDKENSIYRKYIYFWLREKDGGKDFYKERGDSILILDTIFHYLRSNTFSLYSDYKFEQIVKHTSIGMNQEDSITHIRLMIDWNYDKKSGEFKNYIIGCGFYHQSGGSEKCFGYMYYPELRILLRTQYPGSNTPSYNEHLQNRNYKASLLKTIKMYQSTLYDYESTYQTRYYDDRTELEPLLDIELLKDEWRYALQDIFTGKADFKTNNGETILGNILGGFMDDKWIWKYTNGKTKMEMMFENGIAHGDFISYWQNGKIREKGKFDFGKRSGNWLSYNEKGVLIAKRNYLNGWMSGKQETFYSDGKKHLVYHYKNHLVEGKYENYYPSGTLMSSGYLEKAIMKGKWQFNIEVDDEFIRLNSKIRNQYPKISEEILKDKVISFDAEYIHGYNVFLPFGGLSLDLKVGEMK